MNRPSAEILVGARLKAEDLEVLPQVIQDELEESGEVTVDGMEIQQALFLDDVVGLGVLLFETTGLDDIDLQALVIKADQLKPRLRKLFQEWKLEKDVCVFVSADNL
jgi:hypothetical protein